MHKLDEQTVDQILAHGAWGAFAGMAVIGTVLWWDISGIATMLRAADHGLLSNIFLGGAIAKGTLIGLVVGSARLKLQRTVSTKVNLGSVAVSSRA